MYEVRPGRHQVADLALAPLRGLPEFVRDDPQSQISERWDPSGLWLTSVTEEDGRLKIEGMARDAADLSEFTRRLRASVWFGDITHPDYERVTDQRDKDAQRNLTWKLDVAVLRWN